MPLLRKKDFNKVPEPELLRDDEEVFHCEVTSEIFRDYDEFCQRIILVNSMVWSCSMTGKSNLTYAEALQSEKTARTSLKDFPMELRIPVLYLASKTKRSAFGDMTEDVFTFIKDRFFVGEIIESCFTENNWKESYVLQVIAPSEEQIAQYSKTNSKSTEKPAFSPAPSLYRYEVEQLDATDQDSSQVMILEASHIRRKKGPFTKEKNRLFLKQFVELNDQGLVAIKESVKRKYKLDKVRFDQLFDGPLPEFEHTKRAPKVLNGKTKDKKAKQESISKFLDKANTNNNGKGKNLMEEMKRKEMEYKQKLEEMKQKRIEEKKLEKEKRKEESSKVAAYVKNWYKPRDDLLLEDQKPLPPPTNVQTRIPDKYFGDCLMVLEFVNSFASILTAKDFFPGGLTLDLIERAVLEKEVAGPLTDLLQMLLTTLFNVQAEEAAENKMCQTDLNSEDRNESMSLSEASRLATLALNWSMMYQGIPLSRLPLYPLTMTEVLRLHLLSSGALLSEAATKWRFQQRGGYASEDDPGLTLRIKNPHILKALAVHNVNQLPVGDKLKILNCLIDQLLTYADVRDVIEERLDKTRQLKLELRSLQSAEKRNEQEAGTAKAKIRREHKGEEILITKELEKITVESDKKRADLEYRIMEVSKSLSEHQTVYGTDRAYQKYVKIDSLPGFFVVNDEENPGTCVDKLIAQKPELIGLSTEDTVVHLKKLLEENYGSDKENDNGVKKGLKKLNGVKGLSKIETQSTRDLLMCTANNQPCPIHSQLNKPSWHFYHDKNDIQNLISSLNKRGYRESELRQALECDKPRLEKVVTDTHAMKLNPSLAIPEEDQPAPKKIPKALRYEDSNLGYPTEVAFTDVLNLVLIDSILEMEEKIFAGNLGGLKIKNRDIWRKNLNGQNFTDLDQTVVKREDNKPLLEKVKSEGRNSRPGTPDSLYKDPGKYLGTNLELNGHDEDGSEADVIDLKPTAEQLNVIKTLAIALLQVSQAVDIRYLKKPLGHADATKKKEEVDLIDRWEQSLLASTSYSQVFLHYCTLDNCILWRRSALKARCQVCRRQRDAENMLLCDSCNKGFHLYCLKPTLTVIPKGDWFCNKCKPEEEPLQERSSKKNRKIFTEESEEEDEEDAEEEQESEGSKTQIGDISVVEVCEVCGTGGHVICCDFCPSVYHLECTQPALRRIPRGEWKCHKCRNKSERRSQKRGSDSGSGEEAPQRRSTRRANDSKAAPEDDLPLHNAALQELLSDVLKHKDAWPFTRPVTKMEVPDYLDVITRPMDFGTIKYQLNMGDYHHDAQVMRDCALVFENCDTYNNADADVFKCGLRLLKFFKKRATDVGFQFRYKGMMGSVDSEEEEEEDGPTPPKRSRH